MWKYMMGWVPTQWVHLYIVPYISLGAISRRAQVLSISSSSYNSTWARVETPGRTYVICKDNYYLENEHGTRIEYDKIQM